MKHVDLFQVDWYQVDLYQIDLFQVDPYKVDPYKVDLDFFKIIHGEKYVYAPTAPTCRYIS